jgi:hypothetical protein
LILGQAVVGDDPELGAVASALAVGEPRLIGQLRRLGDHPVRVQPGPRHERRPAGGRGACNPEQEEEASWLAGCLLLPRSLLLREAYNGTSAEDIADKYQVSPHMARFRLNTSGVLLQARRTRANRNT